MKKYIILTLLFSLLNVKASDIVIAVGDAEEAKTSISFQNNLKGSGEWASKFKTVYAKIISDFKFYEHKFTITGNQESSWKVSLRNDENFIYADLKSSSKKIELSEAIRSDEITMAHLIADKVFFNIVSKKSVFNTKILFVSDRTSQKNKLRSEMYLMDFDGDRKQRISYLNSQIISPSLSPDNTKIVYTVIENKTLTNKLGKKVTIKNPNLYIFDLKTRKRKLLSSKKGINSGAVFSDDGKSVFLTLSYQKNANIYKMDIATKKLTKLTNHYSDDVDPHVNSDASKMTFLSGRSGRAMIYTMSTGSVESNVKRISYVGRFNASPRFSPDGSEIVFSSWVDNRFDLYRIDSTGNNLVRLTKNFGSNEEPWFSPDSEFIIFTSQHVISRKKARQDVYIMNKNGKILKSLTKNYGIISFPRWSK